LTGNTSLEYITVERVVPPTIEDYTFDATDNCPIYVPCESVNTYKTSWSKYADRITCNSTKKNYTVNFYTRSSSCVASFIAKGGTMIVNVCFDDNGTEVSKSMEIANGSYLTSYNQIFALSSNAKLKYVEMYPKTSANFYPTGNECIKDGVELPTITKTDWQAAQGHGPTAIECKIMMPQFCKDGCDESSEILVLVTYESENVISIEFDFYDEY
jgi:hypothetical protein